MHDRSPALDPSCASASLSSPGAASSVAVHAAADSSSNSLAVFVDGISVRSQPILTAPPRRRRRELPADFTPRRSFQIAKADQGLDSEMKAKRVLLRRLGLIKDDSAPIPRDTLDKYAHLFEKPLAEDVLEAFADFFGWNLPGRASEEASCTRAAPRLVEA